MIIDNSYFGR